MIIFRTGLDSKVYCPLISCDQFFPVLYQGISFQYVSGDMRFCYINWINKVDGFDHCKEIEAESQVLALRQGDVLCCIACVSLQNIKYL